MAYNLTFYPTFGLVSILTNVSGISSDILSGIYSDILSDIFSGIHSGKCVWHIFWHSFWHLFRHSIWHLFRHSFWQMCLAYLLTFLLAFYLVYLGGFLWLRSGGEHFDPELAVEVRQGSAPSLNHAIALQRESGQGVLRRMEWWTTSRLLLLFFWACPMVSPFFLGQLSAAGMCGLTRALSHPARRLWLSLCFSLSGPLAFQHFGLLVFRFASWIQGLRVRTTY